MMKFVGKASACAAVAVALLFPASAQAGTITSLTLDNTAATASYQQTTNNPCIFGKSCSNPSGFATSAETQSGNDVSYTLTSGATYTVADIVNIVGTAFFVGIDVNSTTSPFATEQLALFSMTVGGDTYIFNPASPQTLFLGAQGNGYSDALLKGFSLAGYASSTQVVFNLDLRHATDGFEQFFLINTNAPIPPPPVPEPASLTLLGLGLAGVARAVRRARV